LNSNDKETRTAFECGITVGVAAALVLGVIFASPAVPEGAALFLTLSEGSVDVGLGLGLGLVGIGENFGDTLFHALEAFGNIVYGCGKDLGSYFG